MQVFFRSILLLFLTAAIAFPAIAQEVVTLKTASSKTIKLYNKAKSSVSAADYDKAMDNLDKILEKEPTFIDGILLKARILYDLDQLKEAESAFEKSIGLDAHYDILAYYQLGVTEWKLQDYAGVIEHLEAFLDAEKRRDNLRKRAQTYIRNAKYALEAIQSPVDYKPQSLGDLINTRNQEIWPQLMADGKTLVYSVNNGQEDLYYSRLINGVWQQGEPFVGINTRLNEAAQTMAADGKTLVFSACLRRDGKGSCDLYISEFSNGRWSTPKNIGTPINTSAWESQPALSADGKTLYFTSNRKGGLGGYDIWVSRRLNASQWSQPENLGDLINTSSDDEAPFLHPDGSTLFFMSKGHPGMGGFDLFFSKRKGQTWSEPTNLGYPINTSANEAAISVSLDGKSAFFASDKYNERDDLDLYTFELPVAIRPKPVTYVEGFISEAVSGRKLIAEAEIIDVNTNEVIYSVTSKPEDGSFFICLPAGKNYAFSVEKKGYAFYSDHFALADSFNFTQPYQLNIDLMPITEMAKSDKDTIESEPIVLKNVFFETGKATLLESSKSELDRLLNLLNENPKMVIQINGHTDDVGQEDDNQQLSEKRALAVYEYLIEKGIVEARLSYKGFGELKPIDTNETEEGRQNNRRTEFVILSNE
ncbi:MAG: OmpA family protein [Bacteroidota bacterium]